MGSLDAAKRTGLKVIVTRPFPHTGPGQATRFVVPGFVERIRLAHSMKAPVVNTGNLEPVRDFLDVRDVVEAYIALLERGTAGEVYNVARGEGIRLEELFFRIAGPGRQQGDPGAGRFPRAGHRHPASCGEPDKIHAATGWAPRYSLEQTLQSMLDAQAH